MSATVAATPAVERGIKPSITPLLAVASAKSKLDFHSILSAFRGIQPRVQQNAALPQSALYTVKNGDTLSAICAASLRAAGEKHARADNMAAAQRVASANGISNPDRIFAGQQLDLSAVATAAVASTGPAQAASQGGGAMAPADYGLAVLAQAISGVRGEKTARTQNMIAGSPHITSQFGLRRNPFNGRAEYHSGIDIAAASGSQIYPVKPGEVTFSGWQPGYGKVVIVGHADGTETVYAHNQRNLVSRGQQIGWNTPVAKVGSTGDSTGPHVHFEVRKNGHAINPTATATASLQVAQAL
jgi:murein DD-endopeptidase MepM/ murein hydrolase activator NlpD